MLNFRPNGRRRIGRLWKRLLGRPKQIYQGLTGDDDDYYFFYYYYYENLPGKDPLFKQFYCLSQLFNPINAELNPICHLLALLGAHHILHVSRIKG